MSEPVEISKIFLWLPTAIGVGGTIAASIVTQIYQAKRHKREITANSEQHKREFEANREMFEKEREKDLKADYRQKQVEAIEQALSSIAVHSAVLQGVDTERTTTAEDFVEATVAGAWCPENVSEAMERYIIIAIEAGGENQAVKTARADMIEMCTRALKELYEQQD